MITPARIRAVVYDLQWPLSLAVLALVFWLLRDWIDALGGLFSLTVGRWVLHLISLPSLQKFPGFNYMKLDWSVANSAGFTTLFGNHLRLAVESIGFALLISLPLGLVLHRFRRAYLPAFAILDGVYTIPSLAVFPVLIQVSWLGISDATVIVVVAAYAQFILIRNIFAGLDSVPPEIKESARGMGLSKAQIFLHIEFPLALPVIVAGLRIATVAAIGIASIAALTGIPDLGQYFFSSRNGGGNAVGEVEAGVIGVVVLALGADFLLRLFERFIPANRVYRIAGRDTRRLQVLWSRLPLSTKSLVRSTETWQQ